MIEKTRGGKRPGVTPLRNVQPTQILIQHCKPLLIFANEPGLSEVVADGGDFGGFGFGVAGGVTDHGVDMEGVAFFLDEAEIFAGFRPAWSFSAAAGFDPCGAEYQCPIPLDAVVPCPKEDLLLGVVDERPAPLPVGTGAAEALDELSAARAAAAFEIFRSLKLPASSAGLLFGEFVVQHGAFCFGAVDADQLHMAGADLSLAAGFEKDGNVRQIHRNDLPDAPFALLRVFDPVSDR